MIELKPDVKLSDIEKLLEIANQFNEDLINAIHPKEYEGDEDSFINLILSALAVPAAEMIRKLTGLYRFEDRDLLAERYL